MVVESYYNDVYSGHELDLDEQGNTFAKISSLWREDPGKSPSDVLDIGCGAGSVSAELVRRAHRVTGLDVMTEAVRRARRRGIDARVHDLNQGLPFEDESFDVVLGLDIFEHVFDPLALLSETNRVLKPGGYAIIMFPLHFDVRQRIRMALGKGIVSYEHHAYDATCSPWSYFHIRFFTLSDVYNGLSRSGLRVEDLELRPMILAAHSRILRTIQWVLARRRIVRLRPSLLASGVLVKVRKA